MFVDYGSGNHRFGPPAFNYTNANDLAIASYEEDNNVPLLDREVPLEHENWGSPCPYSHLGKPKPHPTMTLKGLHSSKRPMNGTPQTIEFPLSKYTINCLQLDEGSLESTLLIREDDRKEAIYTSMILHLEAPNVPKGSRRKETMELRILNQSARIDVVEIMEIGLEYIQEVNLHENGVLEIAFHGMRVDVSSWEMNPSGGFSTYQAFTFRDVGAESYDRIEVVLTLQKFVKTGGWQEFSNSFPRKHLMDAQGKYDIAQSKVLTATENFFYKWAVSHVLKNILEKYSISTEDAEYTDFRVRLSDVKSCVESFAKSEHIKLDLVEDFIGKRYRPEDVRKITELCSPPVDRAGATGVADLVDGFKTFGLSTKASELHNTTRRWCYSILFLSDHLACLDLVFDADLTKEEFCEMLETK